MRRKGGKSPIPEQRRRIETGKPRRILAAPFVFAPNRGDVAAVDVERGEGREEQLRMPTIFSRRGGEAMRHVSVDKKMGGNRGS